MKHPLECLLDDTHQALVAGDLARLAAVAQLAGADLTAAPADRATAARLRQKAQQNARLLQAALRGLQAARHRLAEIAAGPGLSTYDARGRKLSLPRAQPTQPRRI